MTLQERRKQFAKRLYEEHYSKEICSSGECDIIIVETKKRKNTNKIKQKKEPVQKVKTQKKVHTMSEPSAVKRGRPKGSKNIKKRLF